MDENEKLEALKAEASKRGFFMAKGAEKVVKAMFKREKKYGGLYCPCRNMAIYSEDEKKDYACPCKGFENDVEADGECFCGLFVKVDPEADEAVVGSKA